jgi:hypothetical protein
VARLNWKIRVDESADDDAAMVDLAAKQKDALEAAAMYRRPAFIEAGQTYDAYDLKPFSTEFSFTRFLAPLLARLMGRDRVLFVDSDFLFRADVRELFGHFNRDMTVQVVKHDYRPHAGSKMRNHFAQQWYKRKLWSALMLMNVEHCRITPYQVSHMEGAWLHGFAWTDAHGIGGLPHEWHWVPNHSPTDLVPKAVHFTEGTPDVPEYRDQPYADEWLALAAEVQS